MFNRKNKALRGELLELKRRLISTNQQLTYARNARNDTSQAYNQAVSRIQVLRTEKARCRETMRLALQLLEENRITQASATLRDHLDDDVEIHERYATH